MEAVMLAVVILIGLGLLAVSSLIWSATGSAFFRRHAGDALASSSASAMFQALTISLFAFLLVTSTDPLPANPYWIAWIAYWPLVGPIAAIWQLANFFAFAAGPFLVALAAAALTLAATRLRALPSSLVELRPAMSFVMAGVAFLFAAEWQFTARIETAAKSLAPDCLTVGSFAHSLMGVDHKYDLHAKAVKGGVVYGWSFRLGDFYRLKKYGDLGRVRHSLPGYSPCERRTP
jgi:hypothetical protein